MSPKNLLLSFYFGSLNEDERLHMERELLTDAEVLTDYLDLKRELEAVDLATKAPSSSLWEKLKPKTQREKRLYLSISLGAAVAAGIAIIFVLQLQTKPTEFIQPPISNVLFDSSSELPASSGVL